MWGPRQQDVGDPSYKNGDEFPNGDHRALNPEEGPSQQGAPCDGPAHRPMKPARARMLGQGPLPILTPFRPRDVWLGLSHPGGTPASRLRTCCSLPASLSQTLQLTGFPLGFCSEVSLAILFQIALPSYSPCTLCSKDRILTLYFI